MHTLVTVSDRSASTGGSCFLQGATRNAPPQLSTLSEPLKIPAWRPWSRATGCTSSMKLFHGRRDRDSDSYRTVAVSGNRREKVVKWQ